MVTSACCLFVTGEKVRNQHIFSFPYNIIYNKKKQLTPRSHVSSWYKTSVVIHFSSNLHRGGEFPRTLLSVPKPKVKAADTVTATPTLCHTTTAPAEVNKPHTAVSGFMWRDEARWLAFQQGLRYLTSSWYLYNV